MNKVEIVEIFISMCYTICYQLIKKEKFIYEKKNIKNISYDNYVFFNYIFDTHESN